MLNRQQRVEDKKKYDVGQTENGNNYPETRLDGGACKGGEVFNWYWVKGKVCIRFEGKRGGDFN